MKFNPYLFVLSTFAFAASEVCAQVPTTLKDAVERAVLQNPEIKVKYQNLEAVRNEQDAAKGAWRPRIDVDATVGRDGIATPVISSRTYTGALTTIQLRQILFDGYATASEVRRLGHNRQAAYYDLLKTSDQLALDTAGAYLDVQRYREAANLARDNYANHADIHKRISSRVAAGVGRRVDLEQAAGRLALAESNWLTSTSNLHDVNARYQRLTGETPPENLAPAPTLDRFLPSSNALLRETISHNAEFLGAVSTIRAYRADVDVRRSANWPTLELRARQGLERNQNGLSGNYRDSSIQLVLNYNLYRGNSDTARINQYTSKLNAAYDLRDKVCRDVRQTAQIAQNDVSRLEQQVGLLAQHELSTSKAREAYVQQFEVGQRTLLDLLDTENELFQSRRALVNGEYDLRFAKTRVLAAAGSLIGALGLRPLENEAPPAPGGNNDDDDLMRCSTELPPAMLLDKVALAKDATFPASSVPSSPATPMPRAMVAPIAIASQQAPDCQKLTPTVEGWIAAWNQQKSSAYLEAYSPSFVPALGMTQAAWRALRIKRIEKQGGVKAELKNIHTLRCEANTAEVAFTQTFGSVGFKDTVEKTLSLELIKGAWKITRETVTKGRTF